MSVGSLLVLSYWLALLSILTSGSSHGSGFPSFVKLDSSIRVLCQRHLVGFRPVATTARSKDVKTSLQDAHI